jgi:hypothetical protein
MDEDNIVQMKGNVIKGEMIKISGMGSFRNLLLKNLLARKLTKNSHNSLLR